VENNWIMVTMMDKEMNQNTISKMMIAFYQRPYTTKSVKKIEELLDAKKPDEIILLSIAERKKSSGTIKSYLGRKDIEKLKNQYQKDQEIRSTRYADRILKISKDKHISTKKIVSKGNIIEVIKRKMDEYQPDIVVINHSDKSKLDKLIAGCIEEEVVKKCKNNIVIV